jgi:hypothetical protein
MKNHLIYYLFIALSIIVNSCSADLRDEYSKFSVKLAEVTTITTPTTDSTPDYTFSSTDSGAITYGGSCSSSTTIAVSGNNTITLNSLNDGTYADCTITVSEKMKTKKSETTLSGSITITSFTVASSNDTTDNDTSTSDTTEPTIAEVTAVTTPTNDSTPDYTFSSDETGTITYGGSCSSSTTTTITGNNTITLVSLSTGTYSDCTITVTDTAGNISNTLSLSSFFVAELMGGSMQGLELSLSKVVTKFAGTGSSGSADGTRTAASFQNPVGITTDGTNLYVADARNHLIRKIVISTGVVTTVAGTGSSGSVDGTGTGASLNLPIGITVDETNLYVVEQDNYMIRQIVISTGVVTKVAGTGSSGSADGTGTSASFNKPVGITTDGTNLYVGDSDNNLIRKIVISTGVVTTLAGTGSSGSVNATGTSASFNTPRGITTDGTNLYVADALNHLIRQIVISTGVVTTLAGTAGTSGSSNGTGTSASFYQPSGITTDGTNLYVGGENHLIRQIVISTGVVTTVAGTGSSGSVDGTGTGASFSRPYAVTTDGTDLYVSEYDNYLIRKIE